MIGERVKLYLPPTLMASAGREHPQITRGELGEHEDYYAARDGSIEVPAWEVDDFLAMGCTREPQQPAPASPQRQLKP